MPIKNIESIITKALALKPVLESLPRAERIFEAVMFVDDYNITSGSEGTPMGENCFRATIVGGLVKQGRKFEDIADYWEYVCGILADPTKNPGKKVNAIFCFQYVFTISYLAKKPHPEDLVRVYVVLNNLIDETIANCPKDPLYIVYPRTERVLSDDVKNYNCLTLTERIFRDSKAVNQLRDDFWPHGQEGMYKMNICGGVVLKQLSA